MNKQNEKIVIGGMYQYKDGSNSWIFVNKKLKNNTYLVHDIIIDEHDYDDDICEMDAQQIQEVADITKCYVAKYNARHNCFYAVWDGQDKRTLRKIYNI